MVISLPLVLWPFLYSFNAHFSTAQSRTSLACPQQHSRHILRITFIGVNFAMPSPSLVLDEFSHITPKSACQPSDRNNRYFPLVENDVHPRTADIDFVSAEFHISHVFTSFYTISVIYIDTLTLTCYIINSLLKFIHQFAIIYCRRIKYVRVCKQIKRTTD